MRTSGSEDFALPAALLFAVMFSLTVRQATLSSTTATSMQPDYVMTVTAKRLPAECKSAATRTSACDSLLAGDARIEVREGNTRLARAQSVFPY